MQNNRSTIKKQAVKRGVKSAIFALPILFIPFFIGSSAIYTGSSGGFYSWGTTSQESAMMSVGIVCLFVAFITVDFIIGYLSYKRFMAGERW
jgi:hypothetical protein